MIRTITGTVLVSGNLVQDTVVYPADVIPALGTQWVDRIERHMGGNGANTSYAIGILGGRARIAGWIGADAFGEQLRAKLASVGVDTSRIRIAAAEGTSSSVALTRTDGTRGFLNYPGASREAFAGFDSWPPEDLAGCSHYHLGNPFSLLQLRPKAALALASARAHGLTTSLDTAWDSRNEWMQIVEPCLPLTDLLFANEDEIRMLTGHSEPEKAVASFRDAGAASVVVKLGARGSITFLASGEAFETPAIPTSAVDTTGAGDCFAGGYLAGLQRGMPARDAARLASAVGALSVSAIGAVTGLRGFDDTYALCGGPGIV